MCHFQSWKGSSQPKAVYRYTPKPVLFSNNAQLQCCHPSCWTKRDQSKVDSQLQRKDSHTNAVAPEPSDVYYTLNAEGHIYMDSIHDVTDTISAKSPKNYRSGLGSIILPLPSYLCALYLLHCKLQFESFYCQYIYMVTNAVFL